MRSKTVRLISIFLFVVLFTVSAFAVSVQSEGSRYYVQKPRMTVDGTTASCVAKITASGQYIIATLELKQGSTVIASWSGSGTGVLTLSGTATVTSGLTYTLTVSGTIDGVPFTPASITKTP